MAGDFSCARAKDQGSCGLSTARGPPRSERTTQTPIGLKTFTVLSEVGRAGDFSCAMLYRVPPEILHLVTTDKRDFNLTMRTLPKLAAMLSMRNTLEESELQRKGTYKHALPARSECLILLLSRGGICEQCNGKYG